MPDSIQALAKKIKTAHPAYASLDDKELVSKVITKYPQYADTLNPSDVLQLSPQAYSIQGARAAGRKPVEKAFETQTAQLAPQERYLARLPEDQRQAATERMASGTSMAIPEAVLTLGGVGPALVKAPMATLGKMATSAVGGFAGNKAARYGAKELGASEDIQDLAGMIGGTAGAIGGWREPPARIGWKGVGVEVPASMRPIGAARDAQAAMGEFMNEGYAPTSAGPPSTVPESASVPSAQGEAWSMQRKVTPELQQAAAKGDPGAVNVMRRLNPNWRPVIIPSATEGYPVRTGKVGLSEMMAPEPQPTVRGNAAAARTQPSAVNRMVERTKDIAYGMTNPNPEYTHGFKEAASKMSGSPLGEMVGTLRGKGLDIPAGAQLHQGMAAELKMIADELPGKFTSGQRRLLEPLLNKQFESPEQMYDAVSAVRQKLGLSVGGK